MNQSSLIKTNINYYISPRLYNLLIQFGIPKDIAKTKYFFSYYSKTELGWFWSDIKKSYKEQITKLHPDRENGDIEKSTILNSNFNELEKRFNNRFNPIIFPVIKPKVKENRLCKICNTSFFPKLYLNFCSDKCKEIRDEQKRKRHLEISRNYKKRMRAEGKMI